MDYKIVHTESNAHDDSIWSVAWGKNEPNNVEYIVTGSLDDTVKAWKCEDDGLVLQYIFEGHFLGVTSVDINCTGTAIVANSQDNHIRYWNIDSSEDYINVDAGPVNAWSVVFSPDSEYVATCTQNGKIVLYATKNGQHFKELDSTGKFTMCVAIRSDFKQIAGGVIDGMIQLFDVETGKIISTLEGHAMPIRSLCYSSDGKYLLTGSDDCHVKIYEVANGELLETLSGHSAAVLSVSFAPDCRHFASSSSDKTVKLWDMENMKAKECVHTFSNHKDQVWSVKYNPSGSQLVSVSEDKSICIYSCG